MAALSFGDAWSAGDVVRIERLADLQAARSDWRRVAERAGNPFMTWEWASAWWEQHGPGRTPVVLACRRDDGTVAGILPLYVATAGPLRVLRLIGHTVADRQGPICAREDAADVARALRDELHERLSRRHLVIVDRVPSREGWDAMLGARAVRRESSPVLTFEHADWDEFLAGRSRNFREQARRRERKLRREFDVTFRLSREPERLDDDLDELFRLHDARWQDDGSLGFAGPNRAFHRRFAAAALESGWLRLWFAEVAGRPVAAWYGFRYGGAEWYYQSGRDPAWERHSVGFVLLVQTMRAALEDGIRTYHLLLGDEAYKSRFATADDPVETLALASGAPGRVAITGARSVQRVPRGVRRALLHVAEMAGMPRR